MTNPVGTILLVDDEETLRRFSARVLSKHGFDVVSAGAELLLARMPSLRIHFISGYAEDVLATDVGFAPGAAFLGKPFKPKALVTKVREVLGMEQSS
jgi:hypothetical protein